MRGSCFICTLVYMELPLTTGDVLLYLEITVAVLLVVVLYHVLFIAVDLRKVLRKISRITEEVENFIMKPINAADQILEGVIQIIEEQTSKPPKKKKKSSKKKK